MVLGHQVEEVALEIKVRVVAPEVQMEVVMVKDLKLVAFHLIYLKD